MLGHNSPPLSGADDARELVRQIQQIRSEIECIEEAHKPQLDYLRDQVDACRADRDAGTKPLAERAEALRKVLADWLRDDPTGSLMDGDKVVATLARIKPTLTIDAAKLPHEYLSPNVPAIEAAMRMGVMPPGVTIIPRYTLKVL